MTTPDRLAAAVAQGHEDAVQAWPQEDGVTEVTHAAPFAGSGRMPCCGRTPFEVPRTDRMTVMPDLVNCTPAPVSPPAGEDEQERAGTAEVAEVNRAIVAAITDATKDRELVQGGVHYIPKAPAIAAALAAASLLRQDPPQVAGDHSLNALCLLDGCVTHGTAIAPPQVAGGGRLRQRAWTVATTRPVAPWTSVTPPLTGAEDAEAEVERHALANGGCVPADAYRDLSERAEALRAVVEAVRGLADEWLASEDDWIAGNHLDRALSGQPVAQETTHACPPDGAATMPCCGRTPFEVPGDRMTLDAGEVTSGQPVAQEGEA